MNIYVWAVVIFVTVLAAMLWAAWSSGEAERRSLARLADPEPMPYQLTRAGRLPLQPIPPRPGDGGHELFQGASQTGQPFPDTDPLLILSDKMAAEVQLERAVKEMIEDAEQRIPPRWRS